MLPLLFFSLLFTDLGGFQGVCFDAMVAVEPEHLKQVWLGLQVIYDLLLNVTVTVPNWLMVSSSRKLESSFALSLRVSRSACRIYSSMVLRFSMVRADCESESTNTNNCRDIYLIRSVN